jgi:hypothetical protein
MATQAQSGYYERGVQLAEAGKYQEGFDCISAHLRIAPQDVQALNDAGAILHCLGRDEEAIAHLTKARNLDSDSAEVIWNLVEAYLGAGLAGEAMSLFDDMEKRDLLNVDVLNRTTAMLLEQGRKGPAVEVLLRSCRLWPAQDIVKPMLDVIRSKRPRVVFFQGGTGEEDVLAEVREFVQQRFRTEFHACADFDQIAETVRSSDICWFDGGGEALVKASCQPDHPRIIVSLRCCDVRDRWVRQVRWENVDVVMQVGGSAVEETLLEQVPDIGERTRLMTPPCPIREQLSRVNDVLMQRESEIESELA